MKQLVNFFARQVKHQVREAERGSLRRRLRSETLEKRQLLAGFATLGSLSTMALFFVADQRYLLGAALYVVAAAVEKTGALTPIMQRTLGETGTYRRPLLRTLPPTMAASAFLNNTPVVAMLIPAIREWARDQGWRPAPESTTSPASAVT
jgi:hypothetical protein